jgi:hypothetical protein
MIDSFDTQVRNADLPAIGRPRRSLVTLALIFDLDVARRKDVRKQ